MSRVRIVALHASRSRGIIYVSPVINDIHCELRIRTTAGRGGVTGLTEGLVKLGVRAMSLTRPIGAVCRMRCRRTTGAPDSGLSGMATSCFIRAGWIGRVSSIVVVQARQQCIYRVTLDSSRIEVVEMAAGG